MANTTTDKAKTSAAATPNAVKSRGFLKGIKSEFKKIIWPTKKETINYTIVVIAISLLVSAIVYLLDLAFNSLLNVII